jgi:DNA polymerase-1
MKKNLLNLLEDINDDNTFFQESNRFLLIDGLNLFFRNFSAINAVNSKGQHVGGLGGFFRSLGALTKEIKPTKIYMVFDGMGSSQNRKNIIPEYKSGRNIQRITNWDVFDSLDEEDDSKIDQIVRITQYLKTLPVNTISLDRAEADDIIAYMSQVLPQSKEDKVFIVSSDKDYIQLISEQVILYRPIEREYYTEQTVQDKFGMSPSNFILYKLLLGDSSDAVSGIKGLGEKGLKKKFPELYERNLTFDDLIDISESKMKEHIVYARVLHDISNLEDKFKIMDLSKPMLTEDDMSYIDEYIKQNKTEYHPDLFIQMYNEDQLGNLIRNVDVWLTNNFKGLSTNK